MNPSDYNNLKEHTTHGDFSFPYIWYYSEIPEYFSRFAMHWHEEMEVINVFEGEMEININLHSTIIHKGEIAIIKPGILHSFQQSGSQECRYLSLLFNTKLLGNPLTDSTIPKYITPFLELNNLTNPIITPESDGYSDILSNLDSSFNIYDKKQPCYELLLKSKLYELIYLILNNCVVEPHIENSAKSVTSRNIKTVIDYIQLNYKNEITIIELSKLLNLSEHYFMRFFKNNTGITCIEYINDFRINLAANQLTDTNEAINKIACNVGIDNISYFNRLFKKKFSMTPKQYRQKNSYRA